MAYGEKNTNEIIRIICNAMNVGYTEYSTTVLDFLNIAYRDVLESNDWGFVMNSEPCIIPLIPAYSDGSISMTNGSNIVSGNGTTFTSDMIGRLIKKQGESDFYIISAFVSATQLTISSNYSGTSFIDSPYGIYKDTYALPADVDSIVSIDVLPDNQVKTVPYKEFAYQAGIDILSTTGIPTVCSLIGMDSTKNKTIKIYPCLGVGDSSSNMYVRYKKKVSDLVDTTTDYHVLPEKFYRLLIKGAMYWMFIHIKDFNSAGAFREEMNKDQGRLELNEKDSGINLPINRLEYPSGGWTLKP